MILSLCQSIEVTIGNLEVESPSEGVPSLDTGMYMSSQESPFDGRIKALKVCAFLTEPTPNSQDDLIALYFYTAGYRSMGNKFKMFTSTLYSFFTINRTCTFRCYMRHLTSLEQHEVLKGDRFGVFVGQRGCGLSSSLGQQRYFCPAHVNIIDPVRNCSQSLYFNNTRLEGVSMNQMPAELDAINGHPVDVFLNLDVIVGRLNYYSS